jgi:hypothetical protein
MTFDDARRAIAAALQTAWTAQFPEFKLQFENVGNVDLATEPNPFMNVFIKYHDSHQVDMNASPTWRYHGYLHCEAFTKVGAGTKQGNEMLTFVDRLLRGAMLGGITFQQGQPLSPVPGPGWYKQPLMLRFYFDDRG